MAHFPIRKFYWNITMPIYLCIVYGCFCIIMAELSSCDRNHMAGSQPNIFTVLPYKKNLADLYSGTMALWGQGLNLGQFCNFSIRHKRSGILDLRSTISTGFRQSLIPQNCLLNCICSECICAFFFLFIFSKENFSGMAK